MKANYLINGPVTTDIITSLIESSGKTDVGGESVFIGRVRADENNGKRVSAIEYSAYESMVAAEAEKIKAVILSEFTDAVKIEILHSTGIVKAGEVSLLVIAWAGHRHHAVEACRSTVELIKERLPVWKKEIFEDNSTSWKENDKSHTAS
jgi:molybdopterin synthase catalytic subunit